MGDHLKFTRIKKKQDSEILKINFIWDASLLNLQS